MPPRRTDAPAKRGYVIRHNSGYRVQATIDKKKQYVVQFEQLKAMRIQICIVCSYCQTVNTSARWRSCGRINKRALRCLSRIARSWLRPPQFLYLQAMRPPHHQAVLLQAYAIPETNEVVEGAE